MEISYNLNEKAQLYTPKGVIDMTIISKMRIQREMLRVKSLLILVLLNTVVMLLPKGGKLILLLLSTVMLLPKAGWCD